MLGAVLSFAAMAIAVRELQRHMGSFEILFLRSVVMLAIVGAMLARSGTAAVRTQRILDECGVGAERRRSRASVPGVRDAGPADTRAEMVVGRGSSVEVTGILSGSLQKVTIDRRLRLLEAVGLEANVRVRRAA